MLSHSPSFSLPSGGFALLALIVGYRSYLHLLSFRVTITSAYRVALAKYSGSCKRVWPCRVRGSLRPTEGAPWKHLKWRLHVCHTVSPVCLIFRSLRSVKRWDDRLRMGCFDSINQCHSFRAVLFDVKQTLGECRPCCEKKSDVLMEKKHPAGICKLWTYICLKLLCAVKRPALWNLKFACFTWRLFSKPC